MKRSADVLVIGGGVIGLTAAYELARNGMRVAICDSGQFGRRSSWAGAGIIPAPSSDSTPLHRLGKLSHELFAELSSELASHSGIDNGFRPCGGIEFDGGDAESEWGDRGPPLREERIAELEPGIAAGLGTAFHLPALAQVRNPRHLKALMAAAVALGVELIPNFPIATLHSSGPRILAAEGHVGRLAADQFLIAMGAWSGGMLRTLGLDLPIFPVRGQMLLLKLPQPPLRHVLLREKRYVVPRDDGRVLVGSTEDRVGFDESTVASDLNSLREFAVRHAPILADAAIERSWAGVRPGTGDELPYLDRLQGFENGWIAAGHFRAGISLSPGSARVIGQMIRGVAPVVPVEAFRVNRGAVAGSSPAFRT